MSNANTTRPRKPPHLNSLYACKNKYFLFIQNPFPSKTGFHRIEEAFRLTCWSHVPKSECPLQLNVGTAVYHTTFLNKLLSVWCIVDLNLLIITHSWSYSGRDTLFKSPSRLGPYSTKRKTTKNLSPWVCVVNRCIVYQIGRATSDFRCFCLGCRSVLGTHEIEQAIKCHTDFENWIF